MKTYPHLRVSLDKFLSKRGISTYRLMKHLDGIVARGTVYAVAAGDVQRVDLETLSGLIGGLADLTGESVTPNDLLEVVKEPVATEETDSREWFDGAALAMSDRLTEIEKDVPPKELAKWHESFKKAGKPVKYNPKKRVFMGQA